MPSRQNAEALPSPELDAITHVTAALTRAATNTATVQPAANAGGGDQAGEERGPAALAA
jgi:hypothetical protein